MNKYQVCQSGLVYESKRTTDGSFHEGHAEACARARALAQEESCSPLHTPIQIPNQWGFLDMGLHGVVDPEKGTRKGDGYQVIPAGWYVCRSVSGNAEHLSQYIYGPDKDVVVAESISNNRDYYA